MQGEGSVECARPVPATHGVVAPGIQQRLEIGDLVVRRRVRPVVLVTQPRLKEEWADDTGIISRVGDVKSVGAKAVGMVPGMKRGLLRQAEQKIGKI